MSRRPPLRPTYLNCYPGIAAAAAAADTPAAAGAAVASDAHNDRLSQHGVFLHVGLFRGTPVLKLIA